MKKFLIAAAGLVALATPALAADMAPAPAYTKAPPMMVAPEFNWTGFYVGINGGWAQDTTNTPSIIYRQPATSGGAVGGHAGFNYQWNHLVLGIEGDGDWLNLKASAPCNNPTFVCNTNLQNQYSVRGRLGGAWGNALFYVTGGGAWANYNGSTVSPAPAVFPGSSNRSGWIAGVGVEYAVWKNVIVGVEYLHADYGHQNITYDVVYPNIGVTDDIVRARLSYLFNWGGPVVAKY